MIAKLTIAGLEHKFELDRGVSLAIATDFGATGLQHFGAPAPVSQPLAVGSFTGEVASGASANCRTISLTPHCSGTHTETAAHLLQDPSDAWRVVPKGLVPAAVISVAPEPARETSESTTPAPWGTDILITERRLRAAFTRNRPFTPRALIVRTLPNDPAKKSGQYGHEIPPYFTLEAATWLVAHNVQHLVLDVPSLDRIQDDGKLTAHRIFFGLPAMSRAAADVARPTCTVTELAFVPDELADGSYALSLAVPAIGGDAVPSQPILYPYHK
ncbi:MAG TPA: cyclase family protein [Steroidobacteraceae bacterium]|nr:cyclase family protein [Steroidobacteraceae bacterium]HRX87926.1 cyclase family protein [Steroidobacteraceae bacterium]